jgi:hypothetical protein
MLNFLAKFLHRTMLNAPTSERIHDENGWRYKTAYEAGADWMRKLKNEITELRHDLRSLQEEYDRQLHLNDVDKASIQFLGERLQKLEQHPFATQNLKDRARSQKRVKGRFAK